MPLYYVEMHNNNCGIRKAANLQQARANMRAEVLERFGPRVVRRATAQEIAWVEQFGGEVPKGASDV